MKKVIWICAILSILLLVGCGKKDKNPTESETTEETDLVMDETLPLDNFEFYVEPEDMTEVTVTEPASVLAVVKVARYSGLYVEDGSDETVENVACILVENTTEEYLDYGVVSAVICGKECSFTVTGLPAGRCSWVLESNRITVEGNVDYTYVDELVSPLREVVTEDERIAVELKESAIVISNISEKDLASVRVYYKTLREDGYFLGGITYTVLAEGLKAGESRELTAGHCLPEGSMIVRVDIGE